MKISLEVASENLRCDTDSNRSQREKNSLLIMESLICLLNIMFLWLTLKEADITHRSMGALHSYMNLIDCTWFMSTSCMHNEYIGHDGLILKFQY